MATFSHPEYVWSKWHHWFVDMGYPLLDINRYQDGEWGIIQWLKYPVIPAFTECRSVLSGLKNVDITRGFVEKFTKSLDVQRGEFWANQEARSKAVEDEHARGERHAEEITDAATGAIMNNPDLCERIMENGLEEIHPLKIAKHIPSYKW